ncbi:MAG: TonB-dependent receptor domain-containing protein [Caulobacteraceae bacterium]
MSGLAVPSAHAQDQGNAVSEVVVTGSRIARRDYVASSPIVTVTQQSFKESSQVSLEATLNKLPQFNPAQSQYVGDQQPSATNTVGISTVNLRGLGANRTLVLLDGRRPQPANAALVVDLNTIPTAAIDGVEIITGGASAVYGADAVAGVVNFKLKKNFQGFEIDGQWGKTEAGDGAEASASALIGGNFMDNRGNSMVGVSWSQRSEAFANNRDFYNRGFNDPNSAGFSTQPFLAYAQVSTFDFNTGLITPFSQAAVDAIFATKGYAPGTVSAGAAFAVNPDGTIFSPAPTAGGVGAPGWTDTSNPKYKIVTAGTERGNLEEVDRDQAISTPLTRYSVFTNSHYEINEHINAFIQGMYTKSQFRGNFFNSPAVQFWGITVPRDAAHPVPTQLGQLLDSRFLVINTGSSGPPIAFDGASRPWALWQDTFAGRRSQIDTSDNYQVLFGFNGDIPGVDWTWEAFGSRGETSQNVDFDKGWVSKQKLQAVINAPNYGQGAHFNPTDVLPGAPTTPGFSGTCTSGLYNTIFSGGAIAPSQDCIDLISVRMKSFTDVKQDNVEANIQGGLFNEWAGQVRFAIGADYRGESFEYLPDPNLVQNSIVQQPVGLFGSNQSLGRTGAKEAYGELLVPLLNDFTLVKKFELELGARYSDYSWNGGTPPAAGGTNAWTYKAIGNWSVTDWFKIRGGYQKATRAPNVAELFSGQAQTVVVAPGSGDPCSSTFAQSTYGVGPNNTNAANKAQAAKLCHYLIDPVFAGYNPATYVGLFGGNFPLDIAIFEGNPALKSETAITKTLGFVLSSPQGTPSLLSRASLSVDYYNVSIKGGIATVLPQLSYQQCFNSDGVSNPAFANSTATGAQLAAGNPYCNFLQREPGTGFNRNGLAPYVNLGGIKTSGVDVQFDWSVDFKDSGLGLPGGLSANFVMNWLDRYAYQASPTGGFVNYAGTTGNATTGGVQFKYRTYTTFTYFDGPGTLGISWQHLPSTKSSDHVTNPASTLLPVDSYDLFDLFASWKITDGYRVRAGVDNLFDKEPPVVGADPTNTTRNGNAYGSTIPGVYDVLGRRFYVGINARF